VRASLDAQVLPDAQVEHDFIDAPVRETDIGSKAARRLGHNARVAPAGNGHGSPGHPSRAGAAGSVCSRRQVVPLAATTGAPSGRRTLAARSAKRCFVASERWDTPRTIAVTAYQPPTIRRIRFSDIT
jgi:hypothetical protein